MKTGLAGTLVFLLFAAVSGDHSANLRRIEVKQDDLQQLELTRVAKWQRHPPPGEMSGLLNDGIHEDVLYREALTPGLDEGDPVVKHRLAQRMEFLSEGASPVLLQGAPRISFRQLCFSFAREGKRAQALASRAFRKVSGQPVDSDAGAADLADHFILQSYYGDRTQQQIAKVFGSMFVRSLFVLKTGSWQGPIESELGWHLVWIDTITSGSVASFAEVESDPNGSPSSAPKRAAGRLTP